MTPTPEPPYADRVYLRPSDMERVAELERLAAPSEDGALNLGPIIERQRESNHCLNPAKCDVVKLVREVMKLRREAAMRSPGPDATIRSAVRGISAQIDSMTAVFAELREAVERDR